MMNEERLNLYFKRINWMPTNTEPTLSNLQTLQSHHTSTFPFENLNALLDIPILLDIDTLFHKMIIDKRGGYCYEQNVLFLKVLQSMNFKARGLTGRVLLSGDPYPRRTHMLILVEIDNKFYLSDVGFGSAAPCVPLSLTTDIIQATPYGNFKLTAKNEQFILHSNYNNNWKPLYMFDLEEQSQKDFEVGNWFTSTNHTAHFKDELILSYKTNKCRYTLDNNIFSSYCLDGQTTKETLLSSQSIRKVMTEVFNIKLNNLPGLDQKLEILINNNK